MAGRAPARGRLEFARFTGVTVFGETQRVACPGHRQQADAIRRRDRKTAEVLRFTNGADQHDDLALDAHAREARLEALGELGLADARKPRDVHGDTRLQADRNQLDELRELHFVNGLDTTRTDLRCRSLRNDTE